MGNRIAIIGAGITGLSAAQKLCRDNPDAAVSVFERDNEIGGMAKTIEWRGCHLDLGPHRFYTEIPGIENFVRALCNNNFVPVKRQSRMCLNGRFFHYPVSPLDMTKALGLKTSASIALSSATTIIPKRSRSINSYQDYICSRFGNKLYDILLGPYAEKVWGCDASQLEAEAAIVRLKGDSIWQSILDAICKKGDTFVSQFIYPTGGIGVIAAQLAKDLSKDDLILTAGEVQPVIENGVCVGVQSANRGFIPADAALSTIPLPALAKHLFEPDSEPYQAANRLRFRALQLLFLFYEKEIQIKDTWLYFPERDIPFTRMNIPRNFHPDSVPAGKSVICLEFPCDRGDEVFNADESKLRALGDRHLQEMGLADCEASAGLAVRLDEGYPVYSIGYREEVDIIIRALRRIPNLIIAGRQGLFRHNNMDQAIQMGLLAGEHLGQSPTECDRWYDQLSRFDGYRIVD